MISIFGLFSGAKKSTTGFTLIEMMVVVAIFLVITGIILVNAPEVREKLSIELVAQEISINVRGTQVYGVATQALIDSDSNQVQFPSYGIYFAEVTDQAFGNKPRVFGFSDSTNLQFNPDGVAETYTVPDGYKISSLRYDLGDGWQEAETIVIGFVRPSPTARFLINDDFNISGVRRVAVVVESLREKKTKQVSVYSNGQIAVTDVDPL